MLSLGEMPLANALLTADALGALEPSYPLDLVFCPECTLVQITESVPPEQLFRQYLYFSSFSDTVLEHARQLADRLVSTRRLDRTSLVVELASNDGYLLQYFHERRIPVLGIEPALNVAEAARAKGIPTITDFFDQSTAQRLAKHGVRADVVIANNVLAHVRDLNGFVEGIRTLLKDGGLAVIEIPYVKEMVQRCEFDTIYHEHLCYFSATALDRLFHRHGLVIVDVERLELHGGSLCLSVARRGVVVNDSVRSLLAEETALGVERFDFYEGFASRVEGLRASLRTVLLDLKQRGCRVAAYGAAAKGTVLLNYCGIGRDLVDFVVDRSPHKHGRYVAGVHIPVLSPARLLEEMPNCVLLLAWNVASEVLEQQAEYRGRGGRFIVPIPEVKVV